ncbi:MAG: iron-containing alcohol dehydrogenase [Fibrobacter sp.]|nr:iron-containing alcohol dehydrogenase [Fibrobacter sp.]
MNTVQFQFYRTPKIIFGSGQIRTLGTLAASSGSKALLIHGKHSLQLNKKSEIEALCKAQGVTLFNVEVSGEPSPQVVDDIVGNFRHHGIDLIIAIGGGSCLDTGKAVSAMFPLNESVVNYLEIVGTKKHPGLKLPFIAIPTTAGTGSEGSANAVLSIVGKNGFKRSIRHDNLVPDIALIDPDLMISCPREVTAACGMDALTQLIESFVSPKASPVTDALVLSSLPHFTESLLKVAGPAPEDQNARATIAYGSMISGITLANAGLGVVHGLASALGGLFPIPHGVICGTLLAPAIKITIEKLRKKNPNSIAIEKYGQIGNIVLNNSENPDIAANNLVEFLYALTKNLNLPELSKFGVKRTDIEHILKESGNKNNPIDLDDSEIREILIERLDE